MATHLIQAPSLPTALHKYLRTIDALVVFTLKGSEVDDALDKPPVVINEERQVTRETIHHLFCRPGVGRIRDARFDVLMHGE
jgi:hypothetical protein